MKALLILSCLVATQIGQAAIYPIEFAISEKKIVKETPKKDKDFASLIPGDISTYIYTTEEDYYHDYQRSYFAYTWKKGGWDCFRHYEILANGCIPYFINLESCDPNTMFAFPRDLVLEAMNLEGVYAGGIDHEKFDKAKYNEILNKLLDYTRNHLSCRAMAQYLLDQMNYQGTGKILYLTQEIYPDYIRCSILTGLKELLQDRVIDYPKVEHLYTTYPGETSELYGFGFSYSKVLDDLPIDRDSLEERILQKEFDLIIYGSVHRGCPLLDLVKQVYEPEKIAYICGEDIHKCKYKDLPCLFLREFEEPSP